MEQDQDTKTDVVEQVQVNRSREPEIQLILVEETPPAPIPSAVVMGIPLDSVGLKWLISPPARGVS